MLQQQPGGDDPGPGDPGPDADATPRCKYPDSELRLCIEFDDRVFEPAATDTSPYRLDASASQIQEAARGDAPAAATTLESSLTVAETAMLDIREAITFEAWLQVPAYQNAAVIWNQGQYGVGIDIYGRVVCGIGEFVTMSTQPLGTGTWRHVACVYDGRMLSLFVDGSVARCAYRDRERNRPIPTGGKAGTQLASNLVGAIDDVRIYARALAGPEICTHADRTDCTAACEPGSSGGGPGPGG